MNNTLTSDWSNFLDYLLMEPLDDTAFPEFPSWTILPLVLIATFSIIVVRKKMAKTS